MWPKDAHFIHGDSRTGKKTPEYRAWTAMRDRCYNPKTKSYRRYGGRGITVCGPWRESFANFLVDMGRRPSEGHSLDRVDNSGNYTPLNCRWATKSEQAYNRVYKLTPEDVEEIRDLYNSAYEPTCKDLAQQFNVNPSTISRVLTGARHPYAA